MPANSAPQILSIKGECTFRFSNILIIGLCNSLAKSLFSETMPELIPVPLFVLEADLYHVGKFSDSASETVFLSKNV